MKKTKKNEKQAPKGGKQARKDALIEKLLNVDDLRHVAGGVTSNQCCNKKPCE